MSVVLLASPTRRPRLIPVLGVLISTALGGVAIARTSAALSIALVVWCGVVFAAALVDCRAGRLPDMVVLPGISGVIALAGAAGSMEGAVAGASLFGLPVLVVHLCRPDGLGFGDVKYAALLGAGIGIVAVPLVLPAYLLATVGHLFLCWLVRAGDRLVPFGPSLAAASIVVGTLGILGVS